MLRDFSPAPDEAQAPEPLEFDPFEMDWPWPGMVVDPPPAPAQDSTPADPPAQA